MRYNLPDLIEFMLFLSHLLTMTRTGTAEIEEQYIQHFHNYPFSFSEWEDARGWYKESDHKQLKKFCTTAHKVAGFGESIVDTVVLDLNRLTFINENYKARDIRTLTYGINGTLWYLTEGVREDCAFYLNLVNVTTMQFQLREQVCGVEALGVYVPPPIPDALDYN